MISWASQDMITAILNGQLADSAAVPRLIESSGPINGGLVLYAGERRGASCAAALRRNHEREGIGNDANLGRQTTREFAIDLHVYAGIAGRVDDDAVRAQDGGALHSRQAVERHAGEILHIAQGIAAFEKHQLEFVVHDVDAACGFEIAAKNSDFAD